MYLNWMSTESFLLSTREGSKMCFNCIIGNTKLIQHRFIKSFVFELGQICHSEKELRSSSLSI